MIQIKDNLCLQEFCSFFSLEKKYAKINMIFEIKENKETLKEHCLKEFAFKYAG